MLKLELKVSCAGALLLLGCTGVMSGDPKGGNPPVIGVGANGGAGMVGAGGAGPSATSKPEVDVMTIRRLNRTEYSNTLRDLTGTSQSYGDKFPPDNLSFGFDNIGEALTVQPLHIELFEQSADAVLTELFTRPASDAARSKLLACDVQSGGHGCVLSTVLAFAERAFRRPVSEAEVTPFHRGVGSGAAWSVRQRGVERILQEPPRGGRMSMRKLTFSRRLVLGGAAVAIALPFFESLSAREARGQAATAPKRFLSFFAPNGFDMDDFRPVGAPGPLTLGPMMASLEPFKDHLLVLGGLQNTKQDRPLGDHSGGIGSLLTNRTVKYDTEKIGGASIDQIVAEQVGGTTKLKSLEMAGEPGATEGTCDSGYRCSIGNHISFDASGTPLPKLYDPGQIFDRLFEGFDPGASQADIARRNQYRKSVLDAVLGQATELKAKLNVGDGVKLEEYLSAVREVEKRIELAASASCTPPTKSAGNLSDQQRHEVLNELTALAFQCDITRVASLMWGNVTSNRNYAAIGAAGGHHDISHHGGSADNIGKLKKIGKWEMDRLAHLLGELKELPDSDGRTVLDNTLVFYSSDISDGDSHNHDDMPVLLAGGGADFTMNRYLTYPEEPHFGDLFISIANAYGSAVTSFGEHGQVPLAGLKA